MFKRKWLIPLITALFLIVIGANFKQSQQPQIPESQPEFTILAENLDVPWSLDIAPNGDIIFTERNGQVKLIAGGKVQTIHRIDVNHQKNRESGLLGITLSPDYPDEPHVFLYYTYEDVDALKNRVSRFTFKNMNLLNETILLDNIPAGSFHDGGRIKFGPDGKLYITTGDKGIGELAQDQSSLAGKILRLNRDGTIPDDNPFRNSPIYSLGHRNPQGLAWHPESGKLYSTEHGPSGERLRFAHDEINLIEPGANYGWPHIIGAGDISEFNDPIFHTMDDTWAPSGATFLDDPSSKWHGILFVANLKENSIRMISFSPQDYRRVVINSPIFTDFGRVRTVVQGPDGYLYFCTSNHDGRGSPKENDDIIARFKPP